MNTFTVHLAPCFNIRIVPCYIDSLVIDSDWEVCVIFVEWEYICFYNSN